MRCGRHRHPPATPSGAIMGPRDDPKGDRPVVQGPISAILSRRLRVACVSEVDLPHAHFIGPTLRGSLHRKMEIVAVIPARFASTRLPGKPLLSETGRPLIQHVVEAARRAKRLDRVIVATDDARIAEAVARFGGECMMTRVDHPSGTDRVAEVAAGLPDARDRRQPPGRRARGLRRARSTWSSRSWRTTPRPRWQRSRRRSAPKPSTATRRASRWSCPGRAVLSTSPGARSPTIATARPGATRRPSPPGPLRLPPRLPARAGPAPPLAAGAGREAGAAPRPRGGLPDRRRDRRRAEHRDRHARGLPPVRRTLPRRGLRGDPGLRDAVPGGFSSRLP